VSCIVLSVCVILWFLCIVVPLPPGTDPFAVNNNNHGGGGGGSSRN
jgi:hypothetical protein